MSKQLNLFYLALSFFTRLPIPKSMQYSPQLLNKSSRYFSLVGGLLAVILTGVYLGLSQFLSIPVSVVLIMITSLLLTGAFHEDGLADMADGMGGGFTVEKRLSIMKDSRIGTYGTLSLLSVLALKCSLLIEIAYQQNMTLLFFSLLSAYSLSRAVAASLIFDMPYVNGDDNQNISKSKPIAERQSIKDLGILVTIGLLPLLWFSPPLIFSCLTCLLFFRFSFKYWLMAHLKGFNGDCLGAAQQVAELIIYLVIVASLSPPLKIVGVEI